MARHFGGSTDRLQAASLPVAAVPFTVAMWVYLDQNVNYNQLLSFQATNDSAQAHYLNDDSSGTVGAGTNIGNAATKAMPAPQTGAWHLVVGVWASTTDRKLYIDGSASPGTNTTSAVPASLGEFWIGCYKNAGAVGGNNQHAVAHCAVWNSALSTGNIDALWNGGAGAAMDSISPAPVAYWPLDGDFSPEPERVAGINTVSVAGTTKVASPFLVTGKTVTLNLQDAAYAALAGQTAIHWAWWDRRDVASIAEAPVAKGSVETTDGSGVMQIDVSASALTSGQYGLLLAHLADESRAGLWLVPVD